MKKYRIIFDYDTSTYNVEEVRGKYFFKVAECGTNEEALKTMKLYEDADKIINKDEEK